MRRPSSFHRFLLMVFVILQTATWQSSLCVDALASSPHNTKKNQQPTTTNKSTAPPPAHLAPDERQAKMLEKMGYTWNGKAWTRGDADAYQQQRASARSSNRHIRFVDSHGQATSTISSVAAAKRFEFLLTNARKEIMALSKKSLARDRDFKNFAQKKYAVFACLGAELVSFWVLLQIKLPILLQPDGTMLCIDLEAQVRRLFEHPFDILVLGVFGGMILSACRAAARELLPGVEEQDGKIIRILADTLAEDAIALPAANHIRYANTSWKWLSFGGEAIADVNVSLLMNGLLQPYIQQTILYVSVSSTFGLGNLDMLFGDEALNGVSATTQLIASVMAAVLAAIPASIRAARVSRAPFDGIPAECETIRRNKVTAGAYFNMKYPQQPQQQGEGVPQQRRQVVDPVEATACFHQLTDAWLEKFDGRSNGAEWKSPVLAFTGSLACGAVYCISGGSIAAALLARIVAAGDTYLVRNELEDCRESVVLRTNE